MSGVNENPLKTSKNGLCKICVAPERVLETSSSTESFASTIITKPIYSAR